MPERATYYSFTSVQTCNMCAAGSGRFAQLGLRLNRTQGFRPKMVSGVAVSVKQCRDCGLIFADPLPRPENLADHYDSPEEYWGEENLLADEHYFSNEICAVKPLLDFLGGMRALDIGAGTGKAMRALKEAGFDVWGIEPIASFREVAVKNGTPADRIRLSSIEDAEFDSSSFDFVTFGAVLEHLYSPSEALEKALAWLRPGGILHVEVPSSQYLMSRLFNLFFRLSGTNYVTHLSPMHPPFHLYEFAPESFRRHGARNGYSIARYDDFPGEVMHVPRFLHGPLRWYMKRATAGMLLVLYLRKRDDGE